VIHLRLVRKVFTDSFTEGDLYVNDSWFSFVLEDAVRVGPKIHGKTAIPAGKYTVACTYSNRFKKDMTEIQKVPGFAGIRIHQGMTPDDSEGCVLISKRRGQTPGILAAMKAGTLTNQLTEMVRASGGGEIEIVNG